MAQSDDDDVPPSASSALDRTIVTLLIALLLSTLLGTPPHISRFVVGTSLLLLQHLAGATVVSSCGDGGSHSPNLSDLGCRV